MSDVVRPPRPRNAIYAGGCTNSSAADTTGGVIHDYGGAAGSGQPGRKPFVPAGTYSYWSAPGTHTRVAWRVRIDRVDPRQGHFFSYQSSFRGGDAWYCGLQENGNHNGTPIGRCALFSVWRGTDAATDLRGAWAETFGGEGTGYRVMSPFAWVEGVTYRLAVEADAARGDRWWRALVVDEVGDAATVLGSVRAPAGSGDIAGDGIHWVEWFTNPGNPGGRKSCLAIPRVTAFFGTPELSRD
jgi:hypothetical protein